MMWVRQLVPGIAELYGPGRTVIIYTVASVVGFLLSSTIGWFLPGMPFFGAPLHGRRLGVDLRPARRGGLLRPAHGQQHGVEPGLVVRPDPLGSMGFILPGVDNAAHVGGFAGGYLAGRLLDPLKPERIDHVVIAVICLGVSVLSILVPIVRAIVTILL